MVWLLFLWCTLSALSAALVTFLATRAHYEHKYATPGQPSEEDHPATATPQPETDSSLYAKITGTILQEKLFLTPGLGRRELVKRFGLTTHQIGIIFSEAGTSVPEFIRDCRLEYAKNLIAAHPKLTFAEIACASGFRHASTFNVDFKNKYGVTPTEYRKNHTDCHAS